MSFDSRVLLCWDVFLCVYSFMVNACKFTVDAKYQPLKPLGRGAYGVVWLVTSFSTSKYRYNIHSRICYVLAIV
jgi:hypothetical protein